MANKHYYSEEQTSELRLNTIKAKLRSREFKFKSGSGVFSIKRIDKGSELLINKCLIEDGWDVLDLGCGYGAVGIVIKKIFPECSVTLTDLNKRAVLLSKMNAKENNVKVQILQGNLYEPVEEKIFDTILTNPPYNAGRKLCFEIIGKSKYHLKKNGLLQLVARHQKGGKSLKERMYEIFGNVEEIAKGSGYRIYVSKNV